VVVADELTAEQPLTTAWRSQSSAIEFGYSGETKSFESLRREEKKPHCKSRGKVSFSLC
jgi:hypothetical protein